MHTFLKYGVMTLAIMFTIVNVSALTRKQKFGFLDILLINFLDILNFNRHTISWFRTTIPISILHNTSFF